jgi:hypothetical protein
MKALPKAGAFSFAHLIYKDVAIYRRYAGGFISPLSSLTIRAVLSLFKVTDSTEVLGRR